MSQRLTWTQLTPRSSRNCFKVGNEGSTAIVMATHNVYQAKRLADTFAFMLYGRLIKIGHPSEVLEASDDITLTRFLRGELV